MIRQPIKLRSDIKLIDKDIVNGLPINQVAKKYNITVSSLYKYKQRHLVSKVSKAKDGKDLREGDNLLNLLERYVDNVNKVAEACLRELQDPEDEHKLFLGKTALDTRVSYLETDSEGIDRKKTATLQELLDGIDKPVTRVEIKGPDRVQSLINASHVMNKHIQLYAEMIGKLSSTAINVTNQPVFIQLTQVVLQALQPHPEAMQQVAEYLQTLKLEDKTVKSKSQAFGITSPDEAQESTDPIIPINKQVSD